MELLIGHRNINVFDFFYNLKYFLTGEHFILNHAPRMTKHIA